MKYLNAIISKVLAHPAWSGVGSIVAILSLVFAFFTLTPDGEETRTISAKTEETNTIDKKDVEPIRYLNQRVALVIGNSSYKANLSALKNPINDANAIADILEERGFKVIKKLDADRKTIISSVRNFQTFLALGGVGLFYYAGHAVHIDGEDYLIPIDAYNIEKIEDVTRHAINLSILLRPVDKLIEKQPKSNGAIIVYAAGKGQLAQDGIGDHSPFTEQLISDIKQPEYEIFDLFRSLTKGVSKKTNGSQVPWISASVDTEFYFNKADTNIGLLKVMFFDSCRDNPFKHVR